ncbi:MAG: endonuclease NucS [Planctomycetota bacterium]|nr:endonuclease NucS [Planctomycetota bacterium]
MATKIELWEIGKDKNLTEVSEDVPLEEELESWVFNYPELIGEGLAPIGRQIETGRGRLDILCIDTRGFLVVVEVKREAPTREAIGQSIQYATEIENWDYEKIEEIFRQFHPDDVMEEYLIRKLGKAPESLNQAQRIILASVKTDTLAEERVDWLSRNGVDINIAVVRCFKTADGRRFLSRAALISEEELMQRSSAGRKMPSQVSDTPGSYEQEELKSKLSEYLVKPDLISSVIREVLFPLILQKDSVKRSDLKEIKRFLEKNSSEYGDIISEEERKRYAGQVLGALGRIICHPNYNYLRQVVAYDRSQFGTDNFSIEERKVSSSRRGTA